MTDMEVQAGMYRLMCTQQWRPKSTNFGHTKKISRYETRTGLTGCFWDTRSASQSWSNALTSVNGKRGSTQTIRGAWSSTQVGPRPIREIVLGVYRLGSKRGHSYSLGLHTAIFQAEIYDIKACIMENMERGYMGRNIYILSDSHAAIKALNNFQIKYKLVQDCQ